MSSSLLVVLGLACVLVLAVVAVLLVVVLTRRGAASGPQPVDDSRPVASMPWDEPVATGAEPVEPVEPVERVEPAVTEAVPETQPVEPDDGRADDVAAPVVHAPSDDVERTTRISRTRPTPLSDLSTEATPPETPAAPPEATQPPPPPAWSSAIPLGDPEPVVQETNAPWRTADPEPVVVETAEHTYWDDEAEAQARAIDSGLGEDEGGDPPSSTAPTAAVHGEIRDGGYGWGSAAPFADGSMPTGHPVKGHREWMQYHEPGSPWYETTTVDVWFVDVAAAERAGFHRA